MSFGFWTKILHWGGPILGEFISPQSQLIMFRDSIATVIVSIGLAVAIVFVIGKRNKKLLWNSDNFHPRWWKFSLVQRRSAHIATLAIRRWPLTIKSFISCKFQPLTLLTAIRVNWANRLQIYQLPEPAEQTYPSASRRPHE